MELRKESAERILAEMRMEDMPLLEYVPQKTKLSSDWFIQYKKTCTEFLSSLTDSIEELSMMNLSQDEFIGIIMGKRLPKNLSIRLRVPLSLGGAISADNMFLCWSFPTSYNLDKFIILQSGNEKIWLPNPAKKIYISVHTASGGDGGNATEDRLSQIAAQMAARGRE